MSLERIELLSALGREGCPLCWISGQAGRRYLRSFLHEFVLDVGVRVKLHRAQGFCRTHAWELQKLEIELYHDNMGTATVYEDLAGGLARTIRTHTHPERVSAGWFRRNQDGSALLQVLEPNGTCPACDAAEFKAGYLGEFLVRNLLRDEEIREKFQEGFGLCLPHFRVALRMVASEEERQLLVDVEAQKFEALAAQLGTYTRKLSWDHRHEPMGREESSPVRVIEQFVGKKA